MVVKWSLKREGDGKNGADRRWYGAFRRGLTLETARSGRKSRDLYLRDEIRYVAENSRLTRPTNHARARAFMVYKAADA